MASPSSLNRLHYTAFLYAEYVLRNIEKSKPELVTTLKELKEGIRIFTVDFSADAILDSILELECYHHSTVYGCDLFAGACLRKYICRPEHEKTNFSTVIDTCWDALRESAQYFSFQEIIKLSLSDGVYVTHLDSFRNKKYPLALTNEFDTSYFWQHIFFKSDHSFWGDDRHIKYHAPDYSNLGKDKLEKQWDELAESYKKIIPKDEYLFENTSQNCLTVFLPAYEDDFRLEQVLDQIQIITIAFRFDNFKSLFDTHANYRSFIDKFFKKGVYREDSEEFENKVLGLLLWDEYELTRGLPTAIENIYTKHKKRVNSKCYDITQGINPCSRKCAADSGCDKAVQHILNTAQKSIQTKQIATTSKSSKK